MSSCLRLSDSPTPAMQSIGQLTAFDEREQRWVVDGSFFASVAVSELLTPTIGDTVLFVVSGQHDKPQYVITHVLESQAQSLSIRTEKPVSLVSPKISLTATQDVEVTALNKLQFIGKHGVLSFTDSLVNTVKNLIQHVEHASVTAKGMFRTHAKQQVITASEDVRVDGKRINMG